MLIKTKLRLQPQDNFSVEVYPKPKAEFQGTCEAGQKVTFMDRTDLITALVGGFSYRNGQEVMWVRQEDELGHTDHVKEHVSELTVHKIKAEKPTEKPALKPIKVEKSGALRPKKRR